MPSSILIPPTVWPRYTNVADRQTGQADNGPIAQGEPFYKRSPKNRWVAGAPPRTPLGELTVLARPSSWCGGARCRLPKNLNPASALQASGCGLWALITLSQIQPTFICSPSLLVGRQKRRSTSASVKDCYPWSPDQSSRNSGNVSIVQTPSCAKFHRVRSDDVREKRYQIFFTPFSILAPQGDPCAKVYQSGR